MKENIYYSILIYIAIAGISFLLAPLLTYLFLILGALLAGVGFILDVILCIVFWWAGFEGGIGEMIMNWVDVMSPTTAWLVFMGIVTIVFLIFWFICWGKTIQQSEKEYLTYPDVNIDVAKDFCPLINDIIYDYRKGKIEKEMVNPYIKMRFRKWLIEKHNIKNERDIETIWKHKKWLLEI